MATQNKKTISPEERRRKVLDVIGSVAKPAVSASEPKMQSDVGGFKEPTYPTEDDKSLFNRIKEKIQQKTAQPNVPRFKAQFDDLNIVGRISPKPQAPTKPQPLPPPEIGMSIEAPQIEEITPQKSKSFEEYRSQAQAGAVAPQKAVVPEPGKVTYQIPKREPQGEYKEPEGASLLSQILIGLGTTAAGALVGGYSGASAGAGAGKEIIQNYNEKLSDARKAAKSAYMEEKKLRRAEDIMIQGKIAEQQFQLGKEQRASVAKAEENYQKALADHNKAIQDLQFKLYDAGRKEEADALDALLKTKLANLQAQTQIDLQKMRGKSAAQIQAMKGKTAKEISAAKAKEPSAFRGLTPQQVEGQIEKLGEVSDSISKVASSIGQIESQIGFNVDTYNPETNTAIDFQGKPTSVDVPGVNIPGAGRVAFYSSKARMLNDAINKLFNEELFTRGGKAITSQELQRLKSDFSMGKFNTEPELLNALKNYKSAVQKAVLNAEARFMPEVKKEYEARGAQLPGAVIGAVPQAQSPGFSLEELLQEKARRQGGQ